MGYDPQLTTQLKLLHLGMLALGLKQKGNPKASTMIQTCIIHMIFQSILFDHTKKYDIFNVTIQCQQFFLTKRHLYVDHFATIHCNCMMKYI